MKKVKSRLIIVFIFFLAAGQTFSQQRNPRLDSLVNEKDQALLEKKLSALLTSESENDINLVVQYYSRKNDIVNFEKARDLSIEKFPLGTNAFIKAANAVVLETDASKKEKLLNEMVDKFQSRQNYSMYYFDVANTYASAKGKIDKQKVLKYADKITDKNVKYGYQRIIAESLFTNGEMRLATDIVKKSMDSLKAELDNAPLQTETSADRRPMRNPKTEYNSYKLLYAKILNKQGNPKEALTFAREVYKESASPGVETTDVYLNALIANNELGEAFPLMEKMYRQGTIAQEVKSKFKDAYIHANGSDKGYEELIASIKKELRDSAIAITTKLAVTRFGAPTFTLKNMDRKSVSLASLKGKVVVLDFWATWCGPCKKSFPAMQLAINKFKDDKDVVFLFIDTWERIDNPLPSVREYIKDNKYTFNVLMDLKDQTTQKNNVIESYQVRGIPTKFIIDKNGNVAYRLTGFSGGDERAVEELSVMIDTAKQ